MVYDVENITLGTTYSAGWCSRSDAIEYANKMAERENQIFAVMERGGRVIHNTRKDWKR